MLEPTDLISFILNEFSNYVQYSLREHSLDITLSERNYAASLTGALLIAKMFAVIV